MCDAVVPVTTRRRLASRPVRGPPARQFPAIDGDRTGQGHQVAECVQGQCGRFLAGQQQGRQAGDALDEVELRQGGKPPGLATAVCRGEAVGRDAVGGGADQQVGLACPAEHELQGRCAVEQGGVRARADPAVDCGGEKRPGLIEVAALDGQQGRAQRSLRQDLGHERAHRSALTGKTTLCARPPIQQTDADIFEHIEQEHADG